MLRKASSLTPSKHGIFCLNNLFTVYFFFVHNIYGIIIVGKRYSTAKIPLVGKPSFRLNVTAILDDKDMNPKKKPPKRKGENYMNKSMYTSINSEKLPRAHKLIENKTVASKIGFKPFDHWVILDHGIGRYTTHIEMHAIELGAWVVGYDKYWNDGKNIWTREQATRIVSARRMTGEKVMHISSNVMNVIIDDWELQEYCDGLYDSMNVGEKLILTVYEADTPSDTQRAEPLALYVEKIESYYGMKTLRQTKSYAILEKR